MEAPLLEVKDVTKSYFENGKEFKVLDLIRFELAERDFICVVGPSGCGKSTLLRIIVGLEPPTSGQVLFEGSPIRADNPQVAMVFQSFALFPWLTVAQNVELGLEAQGIPPEDRRTRARKFIDAVGLTGFENAFPRELSGGMKQRVGRARARDRAVAPLHGRTVLVPGPAHRPEPAGRDPATVGKSRPSAEGRAHGHAFDRGGGLSCGSRDRPVESTRTHGRGTRDRLAEAPEPEGAGVLWLGRRNLLVDRVRRAGEVSNIGDGVGRETPVTDFRSMSKVSVGQILGLVEAVDESEKIGR